MGIGRDIFYGLGAAASAPVWGVSMLRTGKWRTDWAGRFGRVENKHGDGGTPSRKRLLVHGVSVGEINAVRKLVDMLDAMGDVEVVVSATTNTGVARAEALYGGTSRFGRPPKTASLSGGVGDNGGGGVGGDVGAHQVVRFPLDFSFAINRFLDAVRPDAVALVELEVWPNFVEACARRGIPVCVVNGRLTARSYKGYRRIRPLIAPSFAALEVAGVQTAEYGERFVGLGVPPARVKVLDTMKWDTAEVADDVPGSAELASEMGIDRGRPLVVAGSTSPGEERLLIESIPGVKTGGVQLLIAPRKPEWFEEVVKVANELGMGVVRRTGGAKPQAAEPCVFLLDTIGELKKAYALADVCVVGRSFMGDLYGSDMMEPAALGKPVVIGPHWSDFADTMKALLDAGGVIETDKPGDAVAELLGNPSLAREVAAAGRGVILSRQGATRRYAALLREVLGLFVNPTDQS